MAKRKAPPDKVSRSLAATSTGPKPDLSHCLRICFGQNCEGALMRQKAWPLFCSVPLQISLIGNDCEVDSVCQKPLNGPSRSLKPFFRNCTFGPYSWTAFSNSFMGILLFGCRGVWKACCSWDDGVLDGQNRSHASSLLVVLRCDSWVG